MSVISAFEKEIYTLFTPPVIVGKSSYSKPVSVSAQTIADGVQKLLGDGVESLTALEEKRSVCFQAVTTKGKFFLKVFYQKKNPKKTYALLQRIYARLGDTGATGVVKLQRRVYLSFTPWAEGAPLIRLGTEFKKNEQIAAGKKMGETLCALHAIDYQDYKEFAVKKTTAKKQLRREYFRMKLAGEKNEDVWRLYAFVKVHLPYLDMPPVLCHGDVHANNVLCDRKKGTYTLIDYDSMTVAYPLIDYAPLHFLPKPFAPFIQSVIAESLGGEIGEGFWLPYATAVALYGLTYRKFNQGFVQRALELIDTPKHIPFWK